MSTGSCPHCHSALDTSSCFPGQMVACPICTREFAIPAKVAPPPLIPPPTQPTRLAQSQRLPAGWRVSPKLVLLAVLAMGVALWGIYYVATTPQRVEARATREIKSLLELYLLLDFRPGTRVVVLDGDPPNAQKSFGRQNLNIHSSRWDIEPNYGSAAFPYKGIIEITYTRWASAIHSTREDAQDAEMFLANFDDMRFLFSRDEAQRSASAAWMPARRTWRTTYLYDRGKGTWVEQLSETK